MKSKVVLYYKSLVQEDRNFILDDSSGNQTIQDYLDSLDSVEITDFQYIKHDLVVTIKLDMSQNNLELGNDDIDLNYVSITNYTEPEDEEDEPTYEKTMYYFVAKKNWKAKQTIELVLHMDTLNTFKWNSDYTISPKTLVHRMHKDRFAKFGNRSFDVRFIATQNTTTTYVYTDLIVSASGGTIVSSSFVGVSPSDIEITSVTYQQGSNGKYYIRIVVDSTHNMPVGVTIRVVYKTALTKRIIDMKSEDISVPLYKNKEQPLYDIVEGMTEWSLYYKNSDSQDMESPVDCLLIPNEPLAIKYQGTPGEINTGNLDNGKWAYFAYNYPNQPLTFKQGDKQVSPFYNIDESWGVTTRDISIVAIHNNSGTIELWLLNAKEESFFGTTKVEYIKIGDGNVTIDNCPEHLYGYVTATQVPATWLDVLNYLAQTPAADFHMTALVSSTMMNLQSVDKTLSENIKIIHVPYSPTPYSETNGVYEFAPCWTYNTTEEKLKLTDFSYRWSHDIKTNVDDVLFSFMTNISIVTYENRHVLDSKLYHSDYFLPKFVYDSFNKGFHLELIDFDESLIATDMRYCFEFKFIMSRNLQSKFLFKFDYVYKCSLEDYDNIVAVARNNEEALYSSQYLNYVRTGYNYDVKAKQRQEEALKTGLAISGGSMVASTLVGLATGNPMALGTGLMSGMSFYGQVVNYAKTSAQAEENIQRKLEESKRQAISVLNADDYDLMYEYAQNKPKLCYYQVSERMQKVLDDMFYYCGYSVEEQMIPNVKSRHLFNFVQADLKIVETSNLTSDIENDIIEKFKQGVTFMHKISWYGAYVWDLEQEHENWEEALLS